MSWPRMLAGLAVLAVVGALLDLIGRGGDRDRT